MIQYGVCIGPSDKYERFAKPGIRRQGGLGRTYESRGNASIFTAYNRMLDEASEVQGLEALVLLHDDLELTGDSFEARIRGVSGDGVAVVGAIGGRGVRSVQWSKAVETFGVMPDAYYGPNDHGGGTHDVDIVDGCLLALSPWAVRNLRFDTEHFHGFHGYDADICMQARAAGFRVVVTEFEAFHHTKGGFGDIAQHARTDAKFRRKWGIEPDPLRSRLRHRYPRFRSVESAVSRLVHR